MFKVICPIERTGGTTYWARCGNGFLNKDDSINMYLDLVPVGKDGTVKLQLRELTEEDLRPSAERRADQSGRTSGGGSSLSATPSITADLPF
jgi:hypothetical protein